MQAIILAAGMGKRLKALTKNNTKCMIKVNDVSLIDRMLHQIDAKNLKRIIIVVGYEGQKLIDCIGTLDIKTPIKYIENPIYDKTNNIYSLALAKKELCEDDTLLFESDLIFEDSVIDELLDDPRETLALVDKYQSWMDGTCVKIHDDGTIKAFIPGKHFKYEEINSYYKTVNIYKFSKHFSSMPMLRHLAKTNITNKFSASLPCLTMPRLRLKSFLVNFGMRLMAFRILTLPNLSLRQTKTSASKCFKIAMAAIGAIQI